MQICFVTMHNYDAKTGVELRKKDYKYNLDSEGIENYMAISE